MASPRVGLKRLKVVDRFERLAAAHWSSLARSCKWVWWQSNEYLKAYRSQERKWYHQTTYLSRLGNYQTIWLLQPTGAVDMLQYVTCFRIALYRRYNLYVTCLGCSYGFPAVSVWFCFWRPCRLAKSDKARFLKEHPEFTEISDRKMADWCSESH